MIKVTDLRTGNHLEYLMSGAPNGFQPYKVDWQDLKWCEDDNDCFNKKHRGVAITDSFLYENGFKNYLGKKGIMKYFFGCYIELVPKDNVYNVFYSNDKNNLVELREIKYVHELENLFFGLTGNEIDFIF